MKTLNMNEIDMVSGGTPGNAAVWGTLSLICSSALAFALASDHVYAGNTPTAIIISAITFAGTHYGANLPSNPSQNS